MMAIADWHRALASVGRTSDAVRETLRRLKPWQVHEFSEHGLSYQMCRFCRRSSPDVSRLWKYGVRHYACDDCRDGIIDR